MWRRPIRHAAPASWAPAGGAAALAVQLRLLSAIARDASRHVPLTPGGKNPYEVLNVDLKGSTSMAQVTKQFKRMAVRYHPDRDGGSHDKMAEVNAAHNILKENHGSVLKGWADAEREAAATGRPATGAAAEPGAAPGGVPADKEGRDEQLGRSGGLGATVDRKPRESRSWGPAEAEARWAQLREEAPAAADRMMRRYAASSVHAVFFRKAALGGEVALRERWLRREYCRHLRDDLAELRAAMPRQERERVAADMQELADAVEGRLLEDFFDRTLHAKRQHVRRIAIRGLRLAIGALAAVTFLRMTVSGWWRNSFAFRFKKAIMGA